MNYIICSKSAVVEAERFYNEACKLDGYHESLEVFIKESLFINSESFLYENDCQQSGEFYIWGRQFKGLLQPHYSKKNAFYLKKIYVLKGEEFYRKLPYLYQMSGKWGVVSEETVPYIQQPGLENGQQIELRKFVEGMDSRYGLRRFEEQWNKEDQYNKFLTEVAVKKENNSVTQVAKIEVNKSVCSIYLDSWKECFETEQIVEYCSNSINLQLGKPSKVERDKKKLVFEELHAETLERILTLAKQGSYGTAKMVDLGRKVRLKRQRTAIEKLYNERTVNPKLKYLLMNELDHIENDTSDLKVEELHPYLTRFGDNVMQKQAFLGAIGSSDLFLIQGPPGTGKTTVISELVNYITASNQKVLISSETHIAVDNVLERIDQKENVFPIRLGKEESVTEDNKKYLLDYRVQALIENVKQQARQSELQYKDLTHAKEVIRDKWERKIESYSDQINQLKKSLQLNTFTRHDLNRVLGYQEKVSECSDLYQKLKQLEEEVADEQKVIERLKEEIHSAEMRIALIQENKSKYGEVGVLLSDSYKEQESHDRRQIEKLAKELEHVRRNSAEKTLKQLQHVFIQKCDELDRDKLFLNRKRRDKTISLREFVYQIQNGVRELLYLDQKRKKEQEHLESNIQRELSELSHQKELLDKTKHLRNEWEAALETEEAASYFQDLYIEMANVICATCSGIASTANQMFQDMSYDYVIIDEAAKCNTLDLLIPLTMGKKIVLVGDHKQLSPMIEETEGDSALNPEIIRSIKENTLFKKLYEERVADSCKCMLNTQYRMDEMICNFISNTFYEGKLKNGCGEKHCDVVKIPHSMMWLDCKQSSEKKVQYSYQNEAEADLIIQMLDFLEQNLSQRKTVGIISPYKKQVELLAKRLQDRKYQNVDIENSTVDAFQGKEKQIILFNVVRSKYISGFLKDKNRMNVAISRAQELFVVVGNQEFIKRSNAEVLGELYHYLQKKESVYNANLCEV